jgi:hypothetical protein
LGGFFEKISILEVEIGRNGPRILGVNGIRILNGVRIYKDKDI